MRAVPIETAGDLELARLLRARLVDRVPAVGPLDLELHLAPLGAARPALDRVTGGPGDPGGRAVADLAGGALLAREGGRADEAGEDEAQHADDGERAEALTVSHGSPVGRHRMPPWSCHRRSARKPVSTSGSPPLKVGWRHETGATVERPGCVSASPPSRGSHMATKRPCTSTPDQRGEGDELHQGVKRGERMTTSTGTPLGDGQNSLKVGDRGPTLLEDFAFRDKMFHFDHERIPERVVHARGYSAHGTLECLEAIPDLTRAAPFQRKGKTDRGVRPVLHRGRQPRLRRPGPRRPWLRGEDVHRRGQLGPRRQQHPGLLHPGRDEVPRPRPRGQGGAGPRLAAGRSRPTTPSGTSCP